MKKSNDDKSNSGIHVLSLLSENKIPLLIILVLIGTVVFFKTIGNPKSKFEKDIIPNAIKKVINDPAAKAEVSDVKKVSGVYEFTLTYQGQKYTSYITTDGKIMFVSGIKLSELNKQQEKTQKKLTCNDIPKADRSELTAFIVADCPYGLQMQRAIKMLINQAPAITNNIKIKYIGSIENGKITSMHGDEEAQENLRQICIREEQKDLYWPYVSCYMQEKKSADCILSTGVNKQQLDLCTSDKSKGLSYAQKDFKDAEKFKVQGSPTLLMNNKITVSEFDFGGRNPFALKELVCCGSKSKPDFCTMEISKSDVAVGLSISDEPAADSGSTNSAAGCAPAN